MRKVLHGVAEFSEMYKFSSREYSFSSMKAKGVEYCIAVITSSVCTE
jgi:hypothetical protein